MSETAPDRLERLNLDDILARVERQQAETRKFVAEQYKLIAEQQKLGAEQSKLYSQSLKLNRDRWLAPIIAVASIVGAFAATFAALATVFRH